MWTAKAQRTVSCESLSSVTTHTNLGEVNTCNMKLCTAINEPKISISHPNDVGQLDLSGNKKIEFLPIDIHITFPNLLGFYASECSVKSVGNENFRYLRKLRNLNLGSNQIEKIIDETFAGLEMLEYLWLSKFHCFNSYTYFPIEC